MNLYKSEDFMTKPTFNGMSFQMKFSMATNSRKVVLYNNIDENSVLEAIYLLNKIKELDIKFNKGTPDIEILINTNGGFVSDGMTLISTIESMKEEGYKIITTNIGRAFSMGFLIAICGSERRAYRYAKYMYHDISYGTYGKHEDIIDSVEFSKIMRNDISSIISKYTTWTIQDVERLNNCRKDKFMTAEELKEIKGVDYIV